MLEAVIALGLLAGVFGALLGFAATRLQPRDEDLVERINARLPQTQCAQCGYPGCRPYAEAVARGEADINRCPPGGEHTIRALAELLDRDSAPLDPECGTSIPGQVARIDESLCVGCTLCIDACPVDAIVGAHQHMHTVIRDECTGCELCLEPCPVDCIEMVSNPADPRVRQTMPQATASADSTIALAGQHR